jgi:hypothetical protein
MRIYRIVLQTLRIYDPYFCEGGMVKRLGKLVRKQCSLFK